MASRDAFRDRNRPGNRKEQYGNIILDNETGIVYSYGRHYPLLFDVNGHTFCNTQGYSVTTGKHISYALAHCLYTVKVPNGRGRSLDAEHIREYLQAEYMDLSEELASLRVHGTKREAGIVRRMADIAAAIEAING